MRRIAITSRKGGVGKTTLTANLACALGEKHRSVLVVDMDPQSALTYVFGHDDLGERPWVGDVIGGEASISDCVIDVGGGVHLLPARPELEDVTNWLVRNEDQLGSLSKALDRVDALYDYVLIDTPPSTSHATVASLLATSEYVIPLKAADVLSYRAVIGSLLETQKFIEAGHEMQLISIVPTMVKKRRKVVKKLREMSEALGPISSAVFAESKDVEESLLYPLPVFRHKPDSKVTFEYRKLADELIAGEEQITIAKASASAEAVAVPS